MSLPRPWRKVSNPSRKQRRATAKKKPPQAALRVTQLEDRTTPAKIGILSGAANHTTYDADIQQKIVNTGLFTNADVSVIKVDTTTPSLAALNAFDSVLVFSDNNYADKVTLGNNLASYVDGGKGVVETMFSSVIPNQYLGGTWFANGYAALAPTTFTNTGRRTLGAVAVPGHAVMNGVTSFDGGTSSFRAATTVATNATLIASWSSGEPLVAERTGLAGKVIGLNFFPASGSVLSGGWVPSTDGGKLLANALAYAAPPAPTVTAGVTGGTLTVSDTAGKDNKFQVTSDGTNVTVADAGQNFTFTTTLASVPNGIVINGNGGNDTLTTVGSIPVTITFDGGAGGSDALRVTGTGLAATYKPSQSTTGAGTLTVAGGQTINFVGLEPVDYDVTGGTFTLDTGTGTADNLTVADSTLIDGTTAALKISGTVGGVAIENARVRNSAVNIVTNDGVDTVTISSASGAHGNTSLSVNAGTTAGDTITVNGTATVSGTTTLNAATVNLNADVTNAVTGSTATAVNVTAPGQIQDGVNVAASGATVTVAAGTYNEGVSVPKTLTLKGAQAGVDARTRSGAETVVNFAGGAFGVSASGVTIDGFTLQGQTSSNGAPGFGYAVFLAPGVNGSQVVNNIVQNNQAGLALANTGATQAKVRFNLFRNNSSGLATDIYADQFSAGGVVSNVLIDNNTFTNTTLSASTWAVGVSNTAAAPFTNWTISNNTVTNHGRGFYFFNSSGLSVTGNNVSGTTNYAIGVFGNNGTPANANFTITGNTLSNNFRGVYVSDDTAAAAYAGTLTLSGNGYTTSGSQRAIDNEAATAVTATGETFNGVLASTATTAQQFAIVDAIRDGVDVAGYGLVRTRAGEVFVTPNSFSAPDTTAPSIQRGINVATAGDTVNVAAGTFVEDVTVIKPLRLLGAGPAATTISGSIGGSASTVAVTASNVEVAGFTITREGNTVAQWNDPGLNTAGLAIQGTAVTGALIYDNNFYGNRTAIDVNNSGGHTIRNNVISQNRTGLVFRNQTDNLAVTENVIADNFTVGVLFLDASGGSNSPVQTAANSTFRNNNISGNWYGQIVDRQAGGSIPAPGTTNLKNFSGNWLGTTLPVVTTANSAEPGYAAQIPTIFGGTATAPGGQPDVAGPASANFDITPYLTTGTDTQPGTYGFQGDFSDVTVTPALAQTGATGRITEGYNALTATGTLRVRAGSYAENVDLTAGPDKAVTLAPGASPGQITLTGNLKLDANDMLQVEIGGTAAATQFDNLLVTGTVTLGGAALSVLQFAGFTVTAPGQSFTIIDNDGTDPVSGTFAGLPEGAPIVYAGGTLYISYAGGDGNDVVLYSAPTVNGSPNSDTFVFRKATSPAGTYEVSVNGGAFTNLGAITSLAVNGLGGNDTLTVDNVNGNALLTGGIVFNGGPQSGTPGDALKVLGGAYTTITNTFTNAHDGTISFDGRVLSYAGLEPVLVNVGSVTNVVFNLPAGGSAATLGDDGTTGNGLLRLSSAPTAFEATDFTAPTGSLTVNRGNAADTLTVADLTDFVAGANLALGASGNRLTSVSFTGPALVNDLSAYATTTIGNTAGAAVTASGNATFFGTTITLGTVGTFNFGSLRFSGAGAVSISEASDTSLASTNNANSLVVTSAGGIANANTSTLTVVSNANFSGTSINLGNQGADIVDFGSLTFTSAGSVSISEDSSTSLTGTSTANTLALTSKAGISNTTNASLTVTGLANFNGTAIDLGNQTGDAMNFGSLTAGSAGPVNVAEDSDMAVNTVGGSTVTLASTGAIQDNNAAANNVTATTGTLTAGTTVDLDTKLTNLALSAPNGDAAIREFDGLNVNSANVGTSLFDLRTAGLTTQTGPITAGAFRFTGSGAAMLTNPGNNVATIAADRAGHLAYTDADTLTVGTAGATTGVTLAAGGALALTALTGSLVVNAAVDAAGAVSLNANDGTAAVVTIAAPVSAGTTATVTTQDGDDTIAVAGTGSLTALAGMATVTANAGADTVNLFGPVQGTVGAFVFGNAGNDVFAVTASGTSTLELLGGAGNDDYTVTVGGLDGLVRVTENAAEGADTLTVLGTAAADAYDVNTAAAGNAKVRVTGGGVSGGADAVEYSAGVEQLTLDAQGGDDAYNLWFAQGVGGSFLPALTRIVDTGGTTNDVANLSGTDGADVIDANFTAARTTTVGGETVTYLNGNLDVLNVYAKAGNDVVLAKPTLPGVGQGGPVVHLFGGLPTAPTPLPGDTLVLDVTGVTGLNTATITSPDGSLPSASHKLLDWTSFETVPVPIGLGGTFDFGTAASPAQAAPYPVPPAVAALAPYYRPVRGTDVYPTNGYYGWAAPVNDYDRGSYASQLAATDFRNLLVDGNWFGPSGVQSTFNVAAVAAGAYQVSVTIGDTEQVMDGVKVTVEGAAPILVPTAFQNQYVTVTTVGTDVNGDGKIGVTFEDTGGTHRYWHVNALDVRPVSLISPVTVDRIDATTKAVQATAPLAADGLTAATYQAAGFFPNGVVTVAATAGTLVGVNPATGADAADADPFLAGLQVRADANGVAYFRLVAPTGNAPVTITANAAVVVDAKGTYTQAFALPAARKIDFGPAYSPVAAGYLGVGTDLYAGAATNGLGWLQTVYATDRGPALGGPLFGDFVWNQYGTTGEFNIDVPSAAPQAVTVYVGDYDAPVDTMTVEYFNGTAYVPLATGVRSAKTNSLTFTVTPVAVGGGTFQMRFRFGDVTGPANGWKVQGIEYRPVAAQAALGVTPAGPLAGDGTTVTTYTITGPAGALVTVTPTYGTIVSADASAAYDGFQVLLAGGSGTVSIQAPVVAVGTVASPVGLVTVDGAAAGGFTQQYTMTAVRYDFGPAGSPAAAGFKGLTGAEAFSPQTGFGFAVPVGNYDRDPAQYPALGATGNPDLYRDGANDYTAGTFKVLVQPGQTGIVAKVYAFDAYTGRSYVTVTPEGGAPQTFLTTTDAPAVFTVTGSDANGDGVFDVTISAGFWMANAIEIGSAQLAAGGAARAGTAVTGDALAAITAEAVRQWAALDLTPAQRAALGAVTVTTADLNAAGLLGVTTGTHVTVDDDAAGSGWYLDPTPGDDAEFVFNGADLAGVGDAAGRYDLLTVVAHEIGHALGLAHPTAAVPGYIMNEDLPAGVRRQPALPADEELVELVVAPALLPAADGSLDPTPKTYAPAAGAPAPVVLFGVAVDDVKVPAEKPKAVAQPTAGQNRVTTQPPAGEEFEDQ